MTIGTREFKTYVWRERLVPGRGEPDLYFFQVNLFFPKSSGKPLRALSRKVAESQED